jgi:hypothetical protein
MEKKYTFTEFDENNNIVKEIKADKLQDIADLTGIKKNKLAYLSGGYFRNKKKDTKEFTQKYKIEFNRNIHENYDSKKKNLRIFTIKIYNDNEEKYYKNMVKLSDEFNISIFKIRTAIKKEKQINGYYIKKIREYR